MAELFGYCRCSTNDTKQDIQRQVNELKKLGVPSYNIYKEYESGTKRNRKQLDALLTAINEGDTVVITEISRLSRSMKDLLSILELFKDKKIKVVIGSFVLDFRNGSTDPMVVAMVQMMGVFSEMERELTVQRIKSGLENAREKGVMLGRKQVTVDDIPPLFKKNYPKYLRKEINVTELGRLSEIKSRTTVYKYIKMMKEEKNNKTTTKRGNFMKTGRLGLNTDNNRYGLLVSDLWEHKGFNCGEQLEVNINGEWVATRMEMDVNMQWYLVGTPYKGDLEFIQARIKG